MSKFFLKSLSRINFTQLEEAVWRPVKLPEKKDAATDDIDLALDIELDLALFDL